VLGLAPGGSVRGAAYRVAASQWEEVYAYLREREQPTETYFEAWSDLKIEGEAGKVSSLVFLSDMKHSQWAGALTLEQQADLIAGAKGLSGRNIDYLSDLVGHLREDGLRDLAMETLLKLVEARESGPANSSL
jgi:cation transport protein ChaC